jgi:hypothetical protein
MVIIDIQPGAYICVESGANINLQDANSIISIQIGAHLGANPALFNNASCQSIISYTGNGKVVLPINGSNYMSCANVTFSVDSLPGAVYKWTTSPDIKIISGDSTSTVKVTALSKNPAAWIQVEIQINGESYVYQKQIAIKNLPDNFVLNWREIIKPPKDGYKAILIAATPTNEVFSGLWKYRWKASSGIIITGDEISKYMPPMSTIKAEILNLINSAIISKQAVSSVTAGKTTLVQPLASAESDENSQSKSALFEITEIDGEETTTEYITVETDGVSVKAILMLSK